MIKKAFYVLLAVAVCGMGFLAFAPMGQAMPGATSSAAAQTTPPAPTVTLKVVTVNIQGVKIRTAGVAGVAQNRRL